MEKAYIYLVRRNKKDTKIVGVLQSSEPIYPSRLDLNCFPAKIKLNLQNIANEHKMDWEMWIETVENYNLLKDSLLARGITAASSPNSPIINLEDYEIPKFSIIKLNKNKFMIRRKH